MKRLKLLWLTFAVCGGILFCSIDARAVSYAFTNFNYDVGAGKVYGTSQTYLDYTLDPYYNAGVDGFLLRYTDATLQSYQMLNSGMHNHSNNAVFLTVANVQRGEIYAVFSDHWIQTLVVQSGYYYDPYGMSYNFAGNGGSPYYGFQGSPPTYVSQQWFRIGRTGVIVALPNITQVAPEAGLLGTTSIVQIVGKYLGEHTQIPPNVNVSGSGVTAQFQSFLPNGIEVAMQVAEDADTGNRNLSLTADGVASNTVQFRVGDRTPQVTGITPLEGSTGEQVAVTITGTGFGVNPQVQIDGLGVNPTINSATATEIQAVFSVADSTYAGNRNVKVKSNGRLGMGFGSGAGNSDTSNSVGFEVRPIIVNITPFEVVGKGSTRNVAIQVLPPNNSKPITLTLVKGTGSVAAQFANNSDTMQITQSGTIVIKGITESSVKDNIFLKANSSNAPSEPFSVATIKINRAITGQPSPTDITDATTTTIVGERINLTASIQPSGVNSSSQTWTIPETIVKDFQASTANGKKIPVDPLNTSNTSFVWVDGGGAALEDFVSKEVKYGIIIDGQEIMVKSTFQVKRPYGTVNAVSANPTTIDSVIGTFALRFGRINGSARDVGIQFRSATVAIPNTFSGDFQWVQLTTSSRTITNGIGQLIYSNVVTDALDKQYPYEPINVRVVDDSPFQELPTDNLDTYYANVDDNFKMWFMFKPSGSGSVWVPIKIIPWQWKAKADNNRLGRSPWQIIGTPTEPSNPVGAFTNVYPEWSSVALRQRNYFTDF